MSTIFVFLPVGSWNEAFEFLAELIMFLRRIQDDIFRIADPQPEDTGILKSCSRLSVKNAEISGIGIENSLKKLPLVDSQLFTRGNSNQVIFVLIQI